jgi:hypothetical protein
MALELHLKITGEEKYFTPKPISGISVTIR